MFYNKYLFPLIEIGGRYMKKTNAMRELDKAGIDYQYYEYEVDEEHLGAIDVALKQGKILAVF